MPVVVDGNNLLHRLPRGRRSRADVRRLVLEAVRHESMRVEVVFDGPPPEGGPARESLGRVSVLYAGSRSADDVILARIERARAPGEWVVVTNDRALERRARQAGAQCRPLQVWRRKIEKGRPPPAEKPSRPLSRSEVADWERLLSAPRPEDDGPSQVPLRRPGRRRRR